MSRVSALCLTDDQRATLERWVRAGTTPQRLVFRSRIVLLAATGMPGKHVATLHTASGPSSSRPIRPLSRS